MQYVNNTDSITQPNKQIVFPMQRMFSSGRAVIQTDYMNRVPQPATSIPVGGNIPRQTVYNAHQANRGTQLGSYRRLGAIPPPQQAAVVAENYIKEFKANLPPTGKMRWGPPIWTFFHTLAEKIKPDQFAACKKELLDQIYSICSNLPCPDCANHATQYMNSINFNTIQTKEDLKNMLFRFHNSVNIRKGTPVFDYAELDAKYSAANTSVVIQNFVDVFAKRNYSVRMIANDFHKQRIVQLWKTWMVNNIHRFEP